MGLWHKYASIAYLAVFLGVCGHASSEFVSVLSGVKGPELSVWRFPPRRDRPVGTGSALSLDT